MKHICPICHKTVKAPSREHPEDARFFPFCSRRCKLIDLGAWLDADYRIISELQSQDTGEQSVTSSDISTGKQ
ncbi:MAG: DNA gyrase inhibitor YacG [Planctomycetota bacterium]|nr:MAG: DNA gyrase inhibitor YacG [Planctomycetota bacterium]